MGKGSFSSKNFFLDKNFLYDLLRSRRDVPGRQEELFQQPDQEMRHWHERWEWNNIHTQKVHFISALVLIFSLVLSLVTE